MIVSASSIGAGNNVGSSGSSSNLRSRLKESILLLRAIVKIQVAALDCAGLKVAARRQTISMASCATSSACSFPAPWRMKYAFNRGAKWRKSTAKAAESWFLPTAHTKAPRSTEVFSRLSPLAIRQYESIRLAPATSQRPPVFQCPKWHGGLPADFHPILQQL